MGSDLRHCVLTLVERKTGFAIIKKLRVRNTDEASRAAEACDPPALRNFKTLTLDNGTEFDNYAILEQRFPVRVCFATPYHSWARNSNENFNGLLRQYLSERHLHERGHSGAMRSHRWRARQPTTQAIRLRHTGFAILSKLNCVALAR